MAFLSDTFTGTDGTLLDAHAPDTGGTWVEHGSGGGGSAVISNANRLYGSVTAVAYYNDAAPASAEYDVDWDVYIQTTTILLHEVGLGRFLSSALTGYGVRWNTSNQWELLRYTAGGVTSLGTWTSTISAGATYHVKLEIRNATKKVYIDGVERISSADNTHTGAGFAGVRFSGTAATNTTLRHIDDFTATDVGGGGTSHALAGTSASTSASTGDLTVAHPLAGTSTGTSTSTGAAVVQWALAGTSAGTSTSSGDLTVQAGGQVTLAGTSAGTSTSTGDLRVAVTLTGTSPGISTSTGAVAVARPLAGTSTGTSTSTGLLSVAGEVVPVGFLEGGSSALSVEARSGVLAVLE